MGGIVNPYLKKSPSDAKNSMRNSNHSANRPPRTHDSNAKDNVNDNTKSALVTPQSKNFQIKKEAVVLNNVKRKNAITPAKTNARTNDNDSTNYKASRVNDAVGSIHAAKRKRIPVTKAALKREIAELKRQKIIKLELKKNPITNGIIALPSSTEQKINLVPSTVISKNPLKEMCSTSIANTTTTISSHPQGIHHVLPYHPATDGNGNSILVATPNANANESRDTFNRLAGRSTSNSNSGTDVAPHENFNPESSRATIGGSGSAIPSSQPHLSMLSYHHQQHLITQAAFPSNPMMAHPHPHPTQQPYHFAQAMTNTTRQIPNHIMHLASPPLPIGIATHPLPPQYKKKVHKIIHPSDMKLAMHPIQAPSPYSKTHQFVSQQIIIWKRTHGSKELNFGVALRYIVKGALVQVETPTHVSKIEDDSGPGMKATALLAQNIDASIASKDASAPVQQPQEKELKSAMKPKRRRVQYGAMTVTSATEQLERSRLGGMPIKPQSMLQNGDIILYINRIPIGDKIFHDATKLFGNAHCREKKLMDGSVVLECDLIVARETRVIKAMEKMEALAALQRVKAMSIQLAKNAALVPIVLPKHPLVVNEARDAIVSGDLNLVEFQAMISGLQDLVVNGDDKIDDSTFAKIIGDPKYESVFIQRTEHDLKWKWVVETKAAERKLMTNAVATWKQEWETEVQSVDVKNAINNSDAWNVDYVSPSDRSKLRSMDRPSVGCKCGKVDHNYVNDAKCALYRNIKRHMDPVQLKELEHADTKESKQLLDKYEGKLNSIGNAHMHRLVKQNELQTAEKEEAKFVHIMENFQVSKLQMAILAPMDLSVMILSAIASLAGTMKEVKVDDAGSDTLCVDSDSDDDDDDDDIPLMALGKKKAPPSSSPQKKPKSEKLLMSMPSAKFMAKVCAHMSKTWGHVYYQPSRVDNAW